MNALMKEDLAIAKNSLLSLYEENRQLKQDLGKDVSGYSMSASGVQITNFTEAENGKIMSVEADELKQRLEEERRLRQESDKELELQVKYLIIS